MNLITELGEASKRAILLCLKSGPKSVNDLVNATGLKQPNVSNHLSRMRGKGIVRSAKVGRQVFYSIGSHRVSEALDGLILEQSEPSPPLQLDNELVRIFCRHAVAGNESDCNALVDRLITQREPLITIYEELFGNAMRMVGTWWEVGAIDVGQEHLASAIVERLMARTVHHVPPAHPGSRRAVLGCPPGNWHTLGLRMVSDLMRLSGWQTFYLGANVPIESFVRAVVDHEPDAVMFSSPLEENRVDTDSLVKELDKLRKSGAKFAIVGGGESVTSHEEEFRAIGVDFVARDLAHLKNAFIDHPNPRRIGQKPIA